MFSFCIFGPWHCAQYCVYCASLDVCGASSLQLCFCTVHVHIQCYSFEWRVFWPFFPLLWAALCFCWTNLTCLAVLTPRGQPSCFLVPSFISENTKDYPLPSWPPMFNLYHWAMRRWGSLVLIAIASKLLCPPLLIRWTDCVGLVYRFSQMEHWSAHQGVPSQSHTIVHSIVCRVYWKLWEVLGTPQYLVCNIGLKERGIGQSRMHTLMRNAMVGSQ